ncbi:MAG: cytochrome c, partial [Nitrospirota bacterium]
AIYAIMTLIGIFMWVSSTNESWNDFRKPIFAVADGTTAATRMIRTVSVILLPFLVGFLSYNSMKPSADEPIELRTVHPAPPASTKVHGKTFVLQTSNSPYRVDDSGKYSDTIQKTHIDGNPWDEKAPPYLQYVREGGQIFFQNCHFCHGDNLNGRGMFAFAFNPIPANFTDSGTIAQLQETFVFWRVAKGGIGLPREAFPWASVMPPWEQHLTVDEIWKVVLFEYWHTGYYPRTWD